MSQYCITNKRIVKVNIPDKYDINALQLGIPVTDNEAMIVGLHEVGDVVLPSGTYGPVSKKNAYGYEFSDKNSPKKYRYVSTNMIYPYGKTNLSMVSIDIYKKCYPKVYVNSYSIELQLYLDKDGNKYVIVRMTDMIRKKYLKEAINLMLEIYGKCYIYDGVIEADNTTIIKRCNWEILPPGVMPSKHVKKMQEVIGKEPYKFDIERLSYIEKYNISTVVQGINGFRGYFAFLFEKYCVLESAFYGNATYIIPKDNWEKLSQKTKKELIDEKSIVSKIDHNSKWEQNIEKIFEKLDIKSNII